MALNRDNQEWCDDHGEPSPYAQRQIDRDEGNRLDPPWDAMRCQECGTLSLSTERRERTGNRWLCRICWRDWQLDQEGYDDAEA